MSPVVLGGRLICVNDEQIAAVERLLPEHRALTRAEPGCLSFEVAPTPEAGVWRVDERFAGVAAFEAHQRRAAGSAWGRGTAGIGRDYSVRAPLTTADAGEVLTVQRAAYVSEAILHDDLALPPLTQTLDELIGELRDPAVIGLGIRENGRLVAAVRLRMRDAVAELGRLTVAPDRQGRGLGSTLLAAVDDVLPPGVERVELFTGEHSLANLRLYRRMGYADVRRVNTGAYDLVFLARTRRSG
ncbi:GNAT family N-acetyltransferase [Gordonia sp. PP30]|uniref:GNAT family N-acetyltransferase n=1 Tax=unclassified Gordonia (in: high G+C Gram-positive bacteria) TaxID=2657482 RepID=UPI001FFEAD4C|nr:GNAT family N-acetyltransferase [Gordonia sp. PP30]UQE74112.1 GNAT family N-acetyltransferase [Gordonia sp. PP30]